MADDERDTKHITLKQELIMSQNTIDFKTFNLVAPFVVADKKPILIRGRHGIGKSCDRDWETPVLE